MIRVVDIVWRVSAKTAWGDLGRLGREGWWELEQRAPPVANSLGAVSRNRSQQLAVKYGGATAVH